jgi:bifunctional UDP-N-acetylglucosamine pyrophosphorylase/glucosamine-1-phosphate N-acetyltransferase
VIVLAAGLGTRMRSSRAKVLHQLGGLPLIRHPLAAVGPLGPARVVVVVGHQADDVREAVLGSGLPADTVLQAEQRGTGHAVQCAVPAMAGFDGDVLVLYGDVPLVTTATLRLLVDTHRREGADLTLLTMRYADPTGYGRILRDAAGRVCGIVEHKDASPAEREIKEVNPGLYCVRASVLFPLLGELRADNAQGELYLTDVVGLAATTGRTIASVELERPDEVAGINTRRELAEMEARLRDDLTRRWMDAGVTFEDPATAYLGPEVEIGRDTVIGPNVVLRGKTRIGEGCRIDGTAFLVDTTLGDRVHVRFACTAEDARVADDAIVGPFARLRPGTELGPRVHIGNFVETKKAKLGAGTKANHLTYLGDCEIGPDTNVGAGTITCNYDGSTGKKSKTVIGARVQIGSDTQLVAPVTVHDDAYVGAGTTVTRDVPPGALVVTRTPPRVLEGWVARRRAAVARGPSPSTSSPSAAPERSATTIASAKPKVRLVKATASPKPKVRLVKAATSARPKVRLIKPAKPGKTRKAAPSSARRRRR